MLGAPLLGEWFFFGAYLLLLVFTLVEFFRLTRLDGARPLMIPGIIAAIWPFIHQFLFLSGRLPIDFISPAILIILLIFTVELFRNSKSPYLNIAFIMMGIVYIGLPFGLLPGLLYETPGASYKPEILGFTLIIIWIHDSGAYFAGSLFGKNRLMPSISPKKTVEGLFGGLAFGYLAVWIISLIFKDFPILHLIIAGTIVMIFANLGDFFESLWKRHLNIKDSGKSLPGHGGWLDRLDSLLFAIPAVYLTLQIIGK